MKKVLIIILLLFLIAGCTKVSLNSEIKETVKGVPDNVEKPAEDITQPAINISETEVESFGDVV